MADKKSPEVIRLYNENDIAEWAGEEGVPPTPAAFACGQCRLIQPSEDLARKHCKPFICETCGKEAVKYQTWCSACFRKKREAKDLENFRNAEKVSYKDYDGPVYVPDASHNEGFSQDVGEYLEWLGDNVGYRNEDMTPEDIPEAVWTCHKLGLRMDAQDMFEMALEDHHDEAGSDVGSKDIKELQDFLDSWCDKQNIESWDPNHGLGVDIPQEIKDEITERARRAAKED